MIVPTLSGGWVKPKVKTIAIITATVKAPAKLPTNTRPQLRNTPPIVTPGRLSISASGASTNTPVNRSKPNRYSMQKPTGNSAAPTIGTPVDTLTLTANAAASARMAPAIYARMIVSRVDMKILDSPASTILVTNSEGPRYAITVPLVRKSGS